MQGQFWVVNSQHTKQEFLQFAEQLYNKHKYITFQWTTGRQRTGKQNNALHLFLSQLADVLNEAGLDMKKTLKAETEIPWTAISAKEHLWRPIQQVMIGKESTAEAERIDYNKIYEVLNRHLSNKFGITVPAWPHHD